MNFKTYMHARAGREARDSSSTQEEWTREVSQFVGLQQNLRQVCNTVN